jgi:formylglycine-generating enzyme required for sulfatase activity
VPWDASSLTGEFYFKRPDGSAPAQTAALAPAPAPQPAAAGADTSRTPEPAVAIGKVFKDDCPNCPDLVSIPAGKFRMGSDADADMDRKAESPAHEVIIAKPFALMTKEVTRDQFAAFAKETSREIDTGCQAGDGGEGKWLDKATFLDPGIAQQGNHPVVCVSPTDAADYADWLSAKTGKHYRLPSEAEWEYAARASKKTAWPWGNDIGANGCKAVNAMDASGHQKYPINDAMPCDDRFVTTAPVGSFPANPWGLYDMLGNVWEMVNDCWHDTYDGAPKDGSSWDDQGCGNGVIRGGAWLENPWDTRFAARWKNEGGSKETTVGFRLARDL